MSCNPFPGNPKSEWESAFNRKEIVISGPKGKYKATNPYDKEHNWFKVDDHLIQGDEPKCDDLLLCCSHPMQAYFIEFKDSKLVEAIEQIKCSMVKLKPHLKGHIFHARIILSSSVKIELRDSRINAFERELKKVGGTFKKASQQLTETL